MEDMRIDLDGQQVDNTQVRVEALREPLRQVFFQRHVELRISVYHVLQPLQAVTEVRPLSRPFKERVDLLELRFKPLHLFLCRFGRLNLAEGGLPLFLASTIGSIFILFLLIQY